GLSGVGSKVSYSNAQPGDLVFFNTYKTNGHVGIYLGGGRFIGSQSSTGVAVANMNSGYWNQKFSGHVRRVR
ncbi:peptidase, partial [Virgibacillus halodenitrificans]|nr:peptidase [Virgibacillus halodenitrificans]